MAGFRWLAIAALVAALRSFFVLAIAIGQAFICSPEMTIETHGEQLRARFDPLCDMIFAPEFQAAPTLATTG
ncbi:hypothetical protein DYI42_02845 [Vannielia litorea]|nr:hypothetical protein [Vannielia litorea]